jgi:uncharacterized protein
VKVTALARYPIKSCRGVALRSVRVQPWGFLGDRRWMLVDAAGKCITAREYPQLVLVDVALPDLGDESESGGFSAEVRAAGRPELRIPEPVGRAREPFTIFRDTVLATPATDEAHTWFSDLLETAVRLVFLDDPMSRPVDPAYGTPTEVVSFADGYPVLLTSVDSLAALNDLVYAGRWSAEGPMSMTRFRPSIVMRGAPAWAEDNWRRIRVGDVVFRVVRACGRCVLTTIDPDTADKGHEPLATLGRHRNWDGKVWFGMNLIPEDGRQAQTAPAPVLRVGDAVEVLD